jgi:anion-transporting  ArsA/GET3 family ATPase
MGKGGVGRSAVSAAIALACAQRGRRTLLYEYSANDRYGGFFGKAPVAAEPVELAKNLFAVNTTPAAAIREYGLMILKFRRVYEAVMENRVTRQFLRAVPGLDDYAILGKAWFHTTEMRGDGPMWDTLVFDMAASGHSVSMLRLPWIILETVPEGPLRRDAREVRELLRSPHSTSIVLVTLAEEMPTNEVLELEDKLAKELSLSASHLVVNQMYPEHFPRGSSERAVAEALATSSGDRDLDALASHAQTAIHRRELNEHYLSLLIERTRAPVSQLPLLFVPTLGKAEIETLARTLSEQL